MRGRRGLCAGLLLGGLLLGAPAGLQAEGAAAGLHPAELVPASLALLLEFDLDRLRQHGPPEAVAHLEQALSRVGVATQGLRRAVLAATPDATVPEAQRPLLLVLEADGEAPDLSRLRERLGDGSPLVTAHQRGVTCRRGRQLGLCVLPEGPVVFGSVALLPAVLDRWPRRFLGPSTPARRAGGRGGRSVWQEAAPLFQRIGAGEALVRIWSRVTPSMRRDLLGAGLPAVPLELVGAARADQGQGVELRALGWMAAPDEASALGGWLRQRMLALSGQTQIQLLGLAGLMRAIEVGTSGAEVTLRLSLSRAEYVGLLERLAGLGALLAGGPVQPPSSSSSPQKTEKTAGKKYNLTGSR
ncbi:MAG: hypothetical protein RMK29_12020 [Myxococcales bacterium]|nr:hypothetical protein [Myxococcota bacterium]MDW8282436.1 hypothetical protein [Myxococcales bacterium]